MRKFLIPLMFLIEGCDLHPIIMDTFNFSDKNIDTSVSENASYGEPRSTAKSYGLPKEKANPDIYGTNEPNVKKENFKKLPDIKNKNTLQPVEEKKLISQHVPEKIENVSINDKTISSNNLEEKTVINETSEINSSDNKQSITEPIKNEQIDKNQNDIIKIDKIAEDTKIKLDSNAVKDSDHLIENKVTVPETVDDKIKIKNIEVEKTIKNTETEKTVENIEIDDVLIVPEKNKTTIKTTISNPSVDTITVKPGDTLYSLSKQYNFIMRDLIELNELQAPFNLKTGTVLKVPNLAFHTVAKGDTLYSISRQYKLDLNNLAKLNNLSEPYSLKVGQKLRLSAPISTTGKLVQPESIAVKKQVEKPVSSTKSDKIETPKLENKKESNSKKVIKKEPEKSKVKPKLEKIEQKEIKKEVKQPSVKSEIKSIPKPDSRSASLFSWPVKGKIISSFGTKANGLYNDGINISAKFGTSVLASENGVVAYAGNEIRGLGNLVIIQHANSWMTVYAHMNDLKVSRGQKVKVGQAIGSIGQTGRVHTPQLHFEIRKDTRAFNPIKQLKAK